MFRNSFLSSSSHVRIPDHGVFVSATLPPGAFNYPTVPRKGIRASTAAITVRVGVDSDIDVRSNVTMATIVHFAVFDSGGQQVASHTSRPGHLPENISSTLALSQAHVWSVARPYLYTLVTTLSVNGQVADSVNTTFGIRSVRWSAEQGLMLNEQKVKLRGFCNHENFAGVGSAVPERVNLFR